MTVQYKFFTISVRNIAESETELNRFLRSCRVVHVKREFVDCQENSFWSIAVEYLSGDGVKGDMTNTGTPKKRIDYKELLSPDQFAVFVRLRDWRKEVAGREAVPVYTIFTNDQLAQMVQNKVTSKAGLGQIHGIGEARIQKYGNRVLSVITGQEAPEKPGNIE